MSDIRGEVPEGKLTVRTRVIDYILDMMREAPFDDEDESGPKLFDTVDKGVLEDISTRETPGLRIEEGPEEVIQNIGLTDKQLRIYFHVKVLKVKGVDPDRLVNYYFGRIVKLIVDSDQHFANLTLGVEEAGNSIERNGSTDPEPGGTMIIDLDYRHVVGDLFKE